MACGGCTARGVMIGQAARHLARGQFQPALAAIAPLPASVRADASKVAAAVKAAAAATLSRAGR